ncbi:carbohydrate ABC transporter permease [Pelagovum pacificum]|uniref:sn-glycerol-3-phosphate transport system permease protein UgpE n=1 Tax=Pelagovum pacificum TaxID=2588711 RepID=A0A5C5GCM1_9RHOB|nr:carbohydrate ABC transporter permease [Pelagovum pacificum]QQA44336.1 carbohydrate ABC transporter permease [Pelagovum pacificum]TNY32545.1 carbohydrate ABC transporter permease [Pelagovum pacificum]
MIGRSPRWAVYIMAVVGFIWIIPIIGIVVMSIRPMSETMLGWWRLDEVSFTLSAWKRVWGEYELGNAFWSTARLAGISTVLTMLMTPAAAYAFHFLKFRFRRLLLIIIINAFVLPQQVVIIPLFRLWRDLGMIDNIAAVVIPYVGMSFAWSIFLVKNFLEDFPKELIEASRIDGCGPISTFRHVVLPNALSPIFAVGILQFLWTWNALLLPMLYLRNDLPLPVVLASVSGSYDPNWDLKAVAAIITTSVPLVIFMIFQRQFAAGSQVNSGGKE